MAMSWWQRQKAVEEAVAPLFPNAEYVYVDEMYDDAAVICAWPKPSALEENPTSEYYRVPYTMTEEGAVTVGTPEKVRRETVYVTFADGAKYRSEVHEDGTVTVFDVPVFKACVEAGFSFDEGWIDRAIAWFRELRDRRGWLPKIVVGHQTGGERPASGFMDNLKRVGDGIVADFVRMPAALFAEFKAGMWPDRSIEAYPAKAQINAVALLGSTPPYHKDLGQVRGFSGGEGRWIPWGGRPAEPAGAKEVIVGDKDTKPQETPAATGESEAKFAEVESRLKAAEEANARLLEENRQNRVRIFADGLRGLLAPAVIESPEMVGLIEQASRGNIGSVAFAEADGKTVEVGGLDLVGRLVARFADQAKKNALLAPPVGEMATVTTRHPGAGPESASDLTAEEIAKFGEHPDMESVRLYRAANALVADEKISFAEATRRVRAAKK